MATTPEDWQEIFDEVVQEAERIILSPAARATYKDPNVTVSIEVDIFRHEKNARARIVSDKNYKIILDAGLVAWLFDLSKTIIHDCPLIFYDIDRNDEDNTDQAAAVLFRLWMNFIVLHEWSHIICGHHKFSLDKTLWLEIPPPETSLTPKLTNAQRICLEAEADAFAIKFLATFHYFSWRIMSEELYGDLFRRKRVAYDTLTGLILLFEAFETINPRNQDKAATHPSPDQRIFIATVFFLSEFNQYPQQDSFNLAEVVVMVNIDYYLFKKGRNQEDFLSLTAGMELFMNQVGHTLATMDREDYRLSTLAYHYKGFSFNK